MKKSILMGVIALMMLVLVLPVMAVNPNMAVVGVQGSIEVPPEPFVSISTDTPLLDFGSMGLGDNDIEGGNLSVSSNTNWQVTVVTAMDPTGRMKDDINYLPGFELLEQPLGQFKEGVGYVPVTDWTWGWFDSSTYPLAFRQRVVSEDKPGDYFISMVYTVVAV